MESSYFIKKRRISSLSEKLLTSQEGLCALALITVYITKTITHRTMHTTLTSWNFWLTHSSKVGWLLISRYWFSLVPSVHS